MPVNHLLNIMEELKKFRERSKLKHLCRSEIYKAYFAHYAAYFDSKDSSKITISGKMFDI